MPTDLYAQQILELWRDPHNFGSLPHPTISVRENNPLCGDDITLQLRIEGTKENARVVDAKFSGHGCAISRASSSLLTDFVKGKTLKDLSTVQTNVVKNLLGVPLSAARIKCAVLPLRALRIGIGEYTGKSLDVQGLYE